MNKDFAQKFIEDQGKGKLMTANDLDSHNWERNKTMMKHDSADKGMHK